MNDKQQFAKIRAGLKRVRDWFKPKDAQPDKPRQGYSGDKSRPHTPRKVRYLHVSDGGQTYRRPELRRHELRKLKKMGLDLTAQENTRQFEGLL